MRNWGFPGRIWRSLIVIYAALSLIVAVAFVILLLTTAEQQEGSLTESLTITIVMLVGAILTAATLATLAHDFFSNVNRQSPHRYRRELGSVFERYVKWFTYVIGPVIASYGIIRIIEALK